ncbi:MAG: protein TolR [Desulfobacterales bacterium]|jgi:biopolymer transport protein TolR|nr:protein TolR [Desulfobacterales bacterium]MDX2511323.1 protein TolR [Desulfobacterales bacterium]
MSLGGNNDRLMSEINVTPFVDVMLVLLIIFMVTAPMMIQGVDVSLPEATSGPLESKQEQLVVTIDQNNQVYINDFRVGIEGLKEKLIQITKNQKADEIYLRADKTVAYGMVVYVMSEIKGAGIEKLGMITDPVDDTENDRKKQS